MLGVRPELVERIADEGVVHRHDHAGRRARAADLFDRQRVADVVRAGASERIGDGNAEQAQLGHPFHQLGRPAAVGVEFSSLGLDLAGGKVTGALLNQALFVGELEIHGRRRLAHEDPQVNRAQFQLRAIQHCVVMPRGVRVCPDRRRNHGERRGHDECTPFDDAKRSRALLRFPHCPPQPRARLCDRIRRHPRLP